MPWGIPLSHGGETAANVEKMESCVQAVMAKGTDKVAAIKICKAQLFSDKKGKK